MFGLTRWNAFDDIFNFQRDVDRAFNQFWNDLPGRTAGSNAFQVTNTEDGWRIDVPLPGVDPRHVNLEVAGNTLNIRAEAPQDEARSRQFRYEQSITVPQFLDIDKLSASHYHGMLQLTVPLKESVKPRKIQIEERGSGQRQLTASGASR